MYFFKQISKIHVIFTLDLYNGSMKLQIWKGVKIMTREFKLDIVEPKDVLMQFIQGFDFDKISFSVKEGVVELQINAPLTEDMLLAVKELQANQVL